MIPALKSEWTKLTTVRSTIVYLILLTGSLFGPVVLLGIFDPTSLGTPTDPVGWGDVLQGMFIFLVLAVVAGAAHTGGDVKNNMAAHAFLTQPRRYQWLAAKMLVHVVFVAIAYLLGTAATVGAVVVLGGHFSLTGWSYFFAGLACAVVLTLVGIGFAAFVRSTVVAIAVPLVWLLIVENLIYMSSSRIGWLDAVHHVTISKVFGDLSKGVDQPLAAAVLLGWVVLFCGAGFWINRRSDVR